MKLFNALLIFLLNNSFLQFLQKSTKAATECYQTLAGIADSKKRVI
jgi:hypothetical protein